MDAEPVDTGRGRGNCTMSFYIRDLNTCRFWYLWGRREGRGLPSSTATPILRDYCICGFFFLTLCFPLLCTLLKLSLSVTWLRLKLWSGSGVGIRTVPNRYLVPTLCSIYPHHLVSIDSSQKSEKVQCSIFEMKTLRQFVQDHRIRTGPNLPDHRPPTFCFWFYVLVLSGYKGEKGMNKKVFEQAFGIMFLILLNQRSASTFWMWKWICQWIIFLYIFLDS